MAEGIANFSGSQCRNFQRLRTLSWIGKPDSLPSYIGIGHEKTILNALEVIETDVLLGKPIHWNVLLPVVSALRADCSTAPRCLKFLIELLSLFERHRCRDLTILSEVFQVIDYLTTDSIHFMDRDKSVELRKTFYAPNGEESELFNGMDLVYLTARSANLGFLKLQLTFGMGMMTPFVTVDSCLNIISFLLFSWPYINFYFDAERTPGFWEICNKRCSILEPEPRKRLWLVLRMLEFVLRMLYKNPNPREHFIDCYRLLFDSIPEAYVTSIEVKSLLEKCLPDTCSTLISRMTEDFKRQLPELAEVPQPRSLQHLCRIRVRQSLRQNLNLPHGVSSLPLPAILKKYVMLHDDGEYDMKISWFMIAVHIDENQLFPKSNVCISESDDCITSFLQTL